MAAFSFTSLAALTAVSTIFLVFIDRAVFREYKEDGNLAVFMSLYGITTLLLVLNCFVALLNHAPDLNSKAFFVLLYVFSITIIQIIMIFFTLFNLIYRSVKTD